jgi:hypothetical protein
MMKGDESSGERGRRARPPSPAPSRGEGGRGIPSARTATKAAAVPFDRPQTSRTAETVF